MVTTLSPYGLTSSINGLLLGVQDDSGVTWGFADIDGWDSPASSPVISNRSQDHGAWVSSPQYYDPRLLTLSGLVIAPDYTTMWAARQQLQTALQAMSSDVPLVVNEPTPKQVGVRKNGRATITPLGPEAFSYSAPLIARDPRKYATSQTTVSTGLPAISGGFSFPLVFPLAFGTSGTGGSVAVTNSGNFETRPKWLVNGPCTNPVIQNVTTGETWTAYITLGSTDQLVVDSDTFTTVLNGQADRSSYVAPGSLYPKLIPGINLVTFQASSYNSQALLQVQYRHAWD